MKKLLQFLLLLALLVSCNLDHDVDGDNYVENTTDKEILITNGNDIFTIPANTTITISARYGLDADIPKLSVVVDNYPRVKMSVTYLGKWDRKYTIKKSDSMEYTIINTGNYTVEIFGNYLGENYGDSVIVEKQSKAVAKFYNGDSSFSAKFVDESFTEGAMPFTNKNGNVITIF